MFGLCRLSPSTTKGCPTDFITSGSLPTFARTLNRTLEPWAIYCDAALDEGGHVHCKAGIVVQRAHCLVYGHRQGIRVIALCQCALAHRSVEEAVARLFRTFVLSHLFKDVTLGRALSTMMTIGTRTVYSISRVVLATKLGT